MFSRETSLKEEREVGRPFQARLSFFFNIYMFMIRLVRDGDREFEATAEDYERIYAFVFRVSGPPAPNIR